MRARRARTSREGWDISSGSVARAAARSRFGVSEVLDRVILAAGVASAVAGAAFLARAGGYYLLPLWERPDSPLHTALQPSGDVGHPFGWIGAALMLAVSFGTDFTALPGGAQTLWRTDLRPELGWQLGGGFYASFNADVGRYAGQTSTYLQGGLGYQLW